MIIYSMVYKGIPCFPPFLFPLIKKCGLVFYGVLVIVKGKQGFGSFGGKYGGLVIGGSSQTPLLVEKFIH